jgi:hypothetical protein
MTEIANKLIIQINPMQLMKKTIKKLMVSGILNAVVKEDNLSEKDERFLKNIMNIILKSLKEEDVNNKYIELYDKYYTEEELEILYNFYSTDLGEKTIEVAPLITFDINIYTSELIKDKQEDLTKLITTFLIED